ncbi:MAG TPA: polysaccharide deacetylase family protein, partial [Xanthobacteraceae bacterium]|nr:polysaccharide deacetylase family protein [Xanthobacteraceae bacterium]
MRLASACVILVVLSIAAYATWAQQIRTPASATNPASTTGPAPTTGQSPTVAPARAAAPAPTPALAAAPPPPVTPLPTCNNPDALGLTRVVEIDTTSGPGFGYEHFKMHDFLRDHEVVLTFDDGPWSGHTPAVLKALADQCLKA